MTDDELDRVLTERLAAVRHAIGQACHKASRDPAEVLLLAVSKTVSPRVAKAIIHHGIRDLGESRPQELWRKAEQLGGVRWHLTGHLQRNKLDRTVPLVSLIHSVDSARLLDALNQFGAKQGEPVPVLLEVNCGREAAKGGFYPEELPSTIDLAVARSGVRLEGLMTMAPHYDEPDRCRPVFAELRELRDRFRASTGLALPQLSMGMSNDYRVAIEEGATIIRLGTTLFGGLESE